MESVSTLLLEEEESNYFSGTYVNEEADFMAQLLGNFSTNLPKVSNFQDSSTFWSHSMKDEEASIFFPTSSGESYHSNGSQNTISAIPFLSKIEDNNLSPNSGKRSCGFEDVHMSWKKTKFTSSDDESNRLQDLSPRPKGVKLSGKKRGSMGSPSTESQSVYAKKRREKINERLRILQNLVPNGTKVDISTMLEEAVEYVKFLQLQIKLLSSDDLWMYAPIAHNGMNISNLPSPR